MKILIAVPSMDMVAAGFAQSLATLNKVGECAVSFMVASLVYDSRNKLAAQAIVNGADYVMWFDSDMLFNPDTLERLMEHMKDKDIVGGLYFRRIPPYTPVAFQYFPAEDIGKVEFKGMDDVPSEPVKVSGIGFGCLLMKTSVLIDVLSKEGDLFTPDGCGEDISFCNRARRCGYDIWLDPSIECGHVGTNVVNRGFYDAYRGIQK